MSNVILSEIPRPDKPLHGRGVCPLCGGRDEVIAGLHGRPWGVCHRHRLVWAGCESAPGAEGHARLGGYRGGRYRIIPARETLAAEAHFDAVAAALLAEIDV